MDMFLTGISYKFENAGHQPHATSRGDSDVYLDIGNRKLPHVLLASGTIAIFFLRNLTIPGTKI